MPDFEIEARGVDVSAPTSRYGTPKVRLALSGVDLGELIDAVGVDEILDAIGQDEVVKHFGLQLVEE